MDGDRAYAQRLVRLQTAGWKRALRVQAPFAWNLRRLHPGFMLDLGCGIGRTLEHVGGRGVGVDVNEDCVREARSRGLTAFTPAAFDAAADYTLSGRFDSLLLAHVVEHLGEEQAVALIDRYRPLVRPGGQLILIAPQEAGFATDPTHVEFVDFSKLKAIASAAGFVPARWFSFPFPRWAGRLFAYNEFVLVGAKREPVSPAQSRAGSA